jgi:alkaline phosphatase
MIKYPDYDNSILSVMSSILKYYGYDTGHTTNKYLDEKLKRKYRNIVFMIFDGMGVSTTESLWRRLIRLISNI